MLMAKVNGIVHICWTSARSVQFQKLMPVHCSVLTRRSRRSMRHNLYLLNPGFEKGLLGDFFIDIVFGEMTFFTLCLVYSDLSIFHLGFSEPEIHLSVQVTMCYDSSVHVTMELKDE